MSKQLATRPRSGQAQISRAGSNSPARSGKSELAKAAEERRARARLGAEVEPILEVQPDERAVMVPLKIIRMVSAFGRTSFDDQEQRELEQSIAENGVLQPVILRPIPLLNGQPAAYIESYFRYELVAGYRRYNAATTNGLDMIPAIIREMDDVTAAAVSLSENLQRKDPSPLDLANSFNNLQEKMQKELDDLIEEARKFHRNVRGDRKSAALRQLTGADYNRFVKQYTEIPPWLKAVVERVQTGGTAKISVTDVAERVNVSARTISYKLSLTKLPPEIIKAMESNEIGEMQARNLALLSDPAAQRRLGREIIRSNATDRPMSALEVLTRVRQINGVSVAKPDGSAGKAGESNGSQEQDSGSGSGGTTGGVTTGGVGTGGGSHDSVPLTTQRSQLLSDMQGMTSQIAQLKGKAAALGKPRNGVPQEFREAILQELELWANNAGEIAAAFGVAFVLATGGKS